MLMWMMKLLRVERVVKEPKKREGRVLLEAKLAARDDQPSQKKKRGHDSIKIKKVGVDV